MFKIDNEAELVSFLKILVEESVEDSKQRLREMKDDYQASSFEARLDKERKALYEEEEEEIPEEERTPERGSPEEAPEENVKDEEESAKDEEVPDEESQAQSVGIEPSLEVMRRHINSLRAGKSLKDSTIKKELEVYYDKLSEEERSVLVLFLRELGEILGGTATGADAEDPSGPPLNINFVVGGEEATSDSEPREEEEIPEEEEEEEPEQSAGEEDTAPPIKVNESQDLRNIRKKIRKLMRN
jgi:hypothetical protein